MSGQPDDEEIEGTRYASRRGEPRVAVRVTKERLAVMTFADAEDLRERLRLLQAIALGATA